MLAKIGFDTAENEAYKDCPLEVRKYPTYFDTLAALCTLMLCGSLHFHFFTTIESFLLTSAKICTRSLHLADRYASAPYGRLQKSGLDRYTKQEINKDPDLMDMQKRSQRSLVGILALTPVPATVSRGRGHVLPVRWVLVGFF